MANLDTRSKRASSVGLLLPFLAVPPLPDGTLGAGDRQHIAFSYSGILAGATAALAFVLDVNTRIMVYLRDLYAVSAGENTALTRRRMDALSSGDANQRLLQIIADATAAMS